MPKISVIIPIYNVENYLEECLNSVINQSFKDIEIILIDDCGTDNSMQIAKDFAKNDNRIRILHHAKNKGLGPARNTGIKDAKGDYIFFLDSDDYLKLDSLEKMYKNITEYYADIAVSWCNCFTDENNEKIQKRAKDTNNWLHCKYNSANELYPDYFINAIDNVPCVAWGKLFSRKFLLIRELEFIDSKAIHEDMGFWIKICSTFPKLSFLKEVSVMYRLRQNAITTEIHEKRNKQKKYRNTRIVVKDAFNYITNKNKIYPLKFFEVSIKNSQTFKEFFEYDYGFFYKFHWQINDKQLRILGLPLFLEKVGRNNKKRGRILGLQIYKTDVLPTVLELENPLKKLNIRKGTMKLTTCNQDKNILDSIKDLQNFYFLPNKGNLGDIVIAASEFQYFDANNLNYKVYEIEKEYSEPFNFIYGGGGIWHRLYQKDYQEIIDIFKSPMLKKCVVLPSSFYDCEDVIHSFDERFTVFCREKQSFEYCKSLNNKAKFILADDMVIGADFEIFKKKFIDSKNFKKFKEKALNECTNFDTLYLYYYKSLKKALCELKQTEKNIGYLFRTDKESVNKIDKVQTIDPSSFAGGFGCDKGLDFLLAKMFLATINSFDIIVTDRLHIGICATKLGKQTLLLDNSYKKLSEVYKNSLYKFENVKLTTLETLEQDIKKIQQNDVKKSDLFETLPVNFDDFLIQYGSFENEYGTERRFW